MASNQIERALKARVFVAGHRGMVGCAIVRRLEALGYCNIVTRTHAELDLTNQAAVEAFFSEERIDQVYLAAAKVGGIHANDTYPADFIYENLMIEANVVGSAHRHGVQKLLFLGSSCIYPKFAPQPIAEDTLLTGALEPTNEPYAIAKIAGIKLCESYNRQFGRDYRSVMPTNLYGPGDNYHPENSHVIPGLIRRFHEAKLAGTPQVQVWGSGRPKREFLYVDDMASASVHVMELGSERWRSLVKPMCSHINVGFGSDITIAELAQLVADTVGFDGALVFDTAQPDGTPRKWVDSALLRRCGWEPTVSLKDGLKFAYDAFLRNSTSGRGTEPCGP